MARLPELENFINNTEKMVETHNAEIVKKDEQIRNLTTYNANLFSRIGVSEEKKQNDSKQKNIMSMSDLFKADWE